MGVVVDTGVFISWESRDRSVESRQRPSTMATQYLLSTVLHVHIVACGFVGRVAASARLSWIPVGIAHARIGGWSLCETITSFSTIPTFQGSKGADVRRHESCQLCRHSHVRSRIRTTRRDRHNTRMAA